MNNLRFRVSSALKDLIGRDLIVNDNIAIFELVKNSYDAYAKKVVITFENNKITIADNGKGMSYDDLVNKWLFLAYSAKKDGTEDSKEKNKSYRDEINRHYAGAKGVGRFSCDRLGEKLVLITKNKKAAAAEKLHIDWTDFEKDQKNEFVNINVNYENLLEPIDFPNKTKTGTILEITNLRANWNRNKILALKRSLEKLINPFSETSDFLIEIICENERIEDEKQKNKNAYDRDIVNGIIKNSISKIIGLKTTKIEVKLSAETIETSLIDRDVEIYKIKEKNIFDKLECVEINLYFLNTAAKRTFTTEMGIQPVNYGSIFLFRNGFRILPFGERGDDSWKLDYRAQQGYNRFLGTRDLFGRVDIQTDKIDDFKEVSSRDGGLIESEMTIQLFRFFDIVHRRLERYVTGVLWGEGFLKRQYFKDNSEIEKNRSILGQDKNLDSANYVINESIGSKIDFIQLVKTLINEKTIEVISYNKNLANIFGEPELFDKANLQVLDDLEKIAKTTKDDSLLNSISETRKKLYELQIAKEKAEQKAEEANLKAEQERKEKEAAQYAEKLAKIKQRTAEKKAETMQRENLFLLSDVNSEIKQLTCLQHTITHNSERIRVKIEKAMEALQKGELDNVTKYLNEIYLLNQQIGIVSGLVSKANYETKTTKIHKDFIEFVYEYINNFCKTNETKFNFHIEDYNKTWVIDFEAVKIIMVLDNLISNSKKAKAKNIFISWSENNEYMVLKYKDDGQGFSDAEIEKVFEYRYSTTGGGGLGMYHIKNIIESDFHGNVSINANCKYGAEFILKFKKGENK